MSNILPNKYNLGCGTGIGIRPSSEGWINVDKFKGKGVDLVMDLNKDWEISDNSATEIHACHLLEHLDDPFHFFKEAHRVLVPNGSMLIGVPYGNNIAAMADPTHKRPYYPETFLAFTKGYVEQSRNLQYSDNDGKFRIVRIDIVLCDFIKKFPFWKWWGIRLCKYITNIGQSLTVYMVKE